MKRLLKRPAAISFHGSHLMKRLLKRPAAISFHGSHLMRRLLKRPAAISFHGSIYFHVRQERQSSPLSSRQSRSYFHVRQERRSSPLSSRQSRSYFHVRQERRSSPLSSRQSRSASQCLRVSSPSHRRLQRSLRSSWRRYLHGTVCRPRLQRKFCALQCTLHCK